MSKMEYDERFASHFQDVKNYDTTMLREKFLIEDLFQEDKIKWTYTGYDRLIVGGTIPRFDAIKIETFEPLKSAYFCERRELGIINLGGNAIIKVDGISYELGLKDALFLTQGSKDIVMESKESNEPAILYINSAPAHKAFSNKLIKRSDVKIMELGKDSDANKRKILQFIVSETCETCQLQMGITELESGSVWNTMPPHTHNRRMEVYLYTDLPKEHAVSHFMGRPDETRHIWVKNNQAVISPNWSIHAGAGTSNYSFLWGMAGENLNFMDMDPVSLTELK